MTNHEIIDAITSSPCDDKLYLICKLSQISGFFATNAKLAYLIKNTDNLSLESIETEYLSFQTNVYIHSIESAPSFENDSYNLIVFKKDARNSDIFSFIELCKTHAQNSSELDFKDFFYSLISLFQLPSEQSFKNALGLFGELKFMQYMLQQHSMDISTDWHKSGSNSLFDFTGSTNYEVKSVLSEELEVNIKHSQIFNSYGCILVVVNCEKYDEGESISDIIQWLEENATGFSTLNVKINLQKELKRIATSQKTDVRFSALKITLFDSNIINPFEVMPDKISNLSYLYDLSDKSYIEEFNYI